MRIRPAWFCCILNYLCGSLLLLGASGCSSFIEGTSQEITVSTVPADASCVLSRRGDTIGEITSPATLLVTKTKDDILVRCTKDGFRPAVRVARSGTAAASVANLLLSAGIGWALDSVAGADNKYDSPINLDLLPAVTAEGPRRLAGAAPRAAWGE